MVIKNYLCVCYAYISFLNSINLEMCTYTNINKSYTIRKDAKNKEQWYRYKIDPKPKNCISDTFSSNIINKKLSLLCFFHKSIKNSHCSKIDQPTLFMLPLFSLLRTYLNLAFILERVPPSSNALKSQIILQGPVCLIFSMKPS